jgi:hypothetical protein
VPEDPIGREIRQLRADLKEDLGEIRADLAGLVSREVHDAHLGRISDRVSTVERGLDRLVAVVDADREAEKRRREDEAKTEVRRREIEDERRAADRRQVKGALIAAVLGVIVQILFATGVLP